MPTPLTVYLTGTADGLVPTANQLTSTAPASEVAQNSLVGLSTGWGVLYAQGNTGPWAAGASEPTFGDVHGFIWDVVTLDGATLSAGSWTANMKLSFGSSLTADIHVRVGKRSSGGVYTQIIDLVLAGQTINTTPTVYTLTGTTGSSTLFNIGDKLYVEIDLNILTNSSIKNTFTVSLSENGGANESIQTPGYNPTLFFRDFWARRIPLIHGGAFLGS